MRILPVSEVKAHLNELVEAADRTHEQVTITKNGRPAAVLVGADDWESLQETLYWMSVPGAREAIAESRASRASGDSLGQDEVRAALGVPRREG
jgi:antitoxin YefM